MKNYYYFKISEGRIVLFCEGDVSEVDVKSKRQIFDFIEKLLDQDKITYTGAYILFREIRKSILIPTLDPEQLFVDEAELSNEECKFNYDLDFKIKECRYFMENFNLPNCFQFIVDNSIIVVIYYINLYGNIKHSPKFIYKNNALDWIEEKHLTGEICYEDQIMLQNEIEKCIISEKIGVLAYQYN